jgi:excinuclease UvrABC nuclease subunit
MQLEGFTEVSAMLSGGVYALVHKGNVVYVGKAKVMLGRVYTHRVAWGKKSTKSVGLKPQKGILFDAIWVRPCPSAEIDELEYRMINLYKPRYNSALRNGLPVPLDLQNLIASIVTQPSPLGPQTGASIRRRV